MIVAGYEVIRRIRCVVDPSIRGGLFMWLGSGSEADHMTEPISEDKLSPYIWGGSVSIRHRWLAHGSQLGAQGKSE